MLANSYSRGAVEKEWNWKIKMNCRRAKSVAMRRYEGCRLDAKEREYSAKENNTTQGVVDVEGAKRCKTARSPVKQRTAVEYDALIRLVKSTKTERRSSPVTFVIIITLRRRSILYGTLENGPLFCRALGRPSWFIPLPVCAMSVLVALPA